jgi:hypothetical protein
MRFGLDALRIRSMLATFGAIGLLAAGAEIVNAHLQERPIAWVVLGLLFLVPAGVGFGILLPMASISLLLTEGFIEQQLWSRFVLSRQPLQALASISPGIGFAAIVLRFRDGSRMSLPVIHQADQARLRAVLAERCPWIEIG